MIIRSGTIARAPRPRLILPLPADYRAVGEHRQAVHAHDTSTLKDMSQPARENTIGYAVEATFALWSGLPMPEPWTGQVDPGHDFVAPRGRVDVKGCASPPWMLPVKAQHYADRKAEWYVLAYVTEHVEYLGWTTPVHLQADGFWWRLPHGPVRCMKVEHLNPDMNALRREIGL